MRLLIYAMESSGASTFCYFVGQRPASVAIIDVWSRIVTPPIDTDHPVVAKATVTMTLSAADHIGSFRPDRTVLFIRDPVAVYASLVGYPYANAFGRIEDKLMRFEHEFATRHWDAIIRYEDFVARDASVIAQINHLGWPCEAGYWDTPRSLAEIRQFNAAASPWCEPHFDNGWGFGNIKAGSISQRFAARPDLPEAYGPSPRFRPGCSLSTPDSQDVPSPASSPTASRFTPCRRGRSAITVRATRRNAGTAGRSVSVPLPHGHCDPDIAGPRLPAIRRVDGRCRLS